MKAKLLFFNDSPSLRSHQVVVLHDNSAPLQLAALRHYIRVSGLFKKVKPSFKISSHGGKKQTYLTNANSKP